MPRRFFPINLDWQRFDVVVANIQSWPAWKKWYSLACLCIGVFLGPIAFYHNGVISISRFGMTQSIALSDHPVLFLVMTAMIEIILVLWLVIWVIILFFYKPFRSDS